MSHQYFVLILPGTIAGTWYDCDPSTGEEYGGNEFDSYEEGYTAMIAAGYAPDEIAPKGYEGMTAIAL